MSPELTKALVTVLTRHFDSPVLHLRPGGGQGNHLTFRALIQGRESFVRIENGPEGDDYVEIESYLLGAVADMGVPAPSVLGFDSSRREVPFAWQVLDCIQEPDLNRQYQEGLMSIGPTMQRIGEYIARWQGIVSPGYGPFDTDVMRGCRRLQGYHASYGDYFRTRLEDHLAFLAERRFLDSPQVEEILEEIEKHQDLLVLEEGCLVHKDLALWNIHGVQDRVTAIIDWDDAIGGDPMDDISLLGCFHDGAALGKLMEGYSAIRPLPDNHRRRFWLHLLRNMIFKAVIRVGAGYFDRSVGFFLIGQGSSGTDLRAFTLLRLRASLQGLRTDADPACLT